MKGWDLTRRRCLRTLARHHGAGRVLAVWPDGELAATAPPGGEVILWRGRAEDGVAGAARTAFTGDDGDVVARVRWPVVVTALAAAGACGERRLTVGDEAGCVAYLALVGAAGV